MMIEGLYQELKNYVIPCHGYDCETVAVVSETVEEPQAGLPDGWFPSKELLFGIPDRCVRIPDYLGIDCGMQVLCPKCHERFKRAMDLKANRPDCVPEHAEWRSYNMQWAWEDEAGYYQHYGVDGLVNFNESDSPPPPPEATPGPSESPSGSD